MSVAMDVNNSESEEVKSSQGSQFVILIIMTQTEQHKLQCMEAQFRKKKKKKNLKSELWQKVEIMRHKNEIPSHNSDIKVEVDTSNYYKKSRYSRERVGHYDHYKVEIITKPIMR